ncbi:TEX11-like protein [Mya arenaria]|uniref:TEX11-like protein n=1 Tax=Mya arenaria TaxID=6604 RepID=A0ABY7EBS6_MYAAR|nr:TEX11-like protein [Mya arenaria]
MDSTQQHCVQRSPKIPPLESQAVGLWNFSVTQKTKGSISNASNAKIRHIAFTVLELCGQGNENDASTKRLIMVRYYVRSLYLENAGVPQMSEKVLSTTEKRVRRGLVEGGQAGPGEEAVDRGKLQLDQDTFTLACYRAETARTLRLLATVYLDNNPEEEMQNALNAVSLANTTTKTERKSYDRLMQRMNVVMWLIEKLLQRFEHSPDLGKLLVTNTEVLLQAGMIKEKENYQDALEWYNYSLALYGQSDPGDAEEAISVSLKCDPSCPQTHYIMFTLALQQNDSGKASESLGRLCELCGAGGMPDCGGDRLETASLVALAAQHALESDCVETAVKALDHLAKTSSDREQLLPLCGEESSGEGRQMTCLLMSAAACLQLARSDPDADQRKLVLEECLEHITNCRDTCRKQGSNTPDTRGRETDILLLLYEFEARVQLKDSAVETVLERALTTAGSDPKTFETLAAIALEPPAHNKGVAVRALKVAIRKHLQSPIPDIQKCSKLYHSLIQLGLSSGAGQGPASREEAWGYYIEILDLVDKSRDVGAKCIQMIEMPVSVENE